MTTNYFESLLKVGIITLIPCILRLTIALIFPTFSIIVFIPAFLRAESLNKIFLAVVIKLCAINTIQRKV
ncbi:hypothetical protein EV214_11379 [Marinisporobacter balticus]|uniref:Uncharacterized protein n=1 Tax=Marinisporobacter balticus TaxID=2018667 RepID=A0A4R2KL92_9FIRM|nr:hypothetical protein EV214_11379 [Marinisporobacter balticus]